MWHGCTLANINDEISMVIAGGYYNGRVTMAVPLTSLLMPDQDEPRWTPLGSLPEERQWGPALGLVADVPIIATGKNYGDITFDSLSNNYYWDRNRDRELRFKREFVVGITVPHTWFPSFCGF